MGLGAAATGYGLLVKDVRGVRILENLFRRNAVGVKVEGAEPGSEALFNEIGFNTVGLQLSANAALTFSANNVVDNVVQLELPGGRTRAEWTKHGVGNHWSDYRGYDLDDDGKGDVPYVAASAADRLGAAAPELRALRGTLAFRLFARTERWWASAQGAGIVDRAPLTRPVTLPQAGLAGDGGAGPESPRLPWAATGLLLVGAAAAAFARGSRR